MNSSSFKITFLSGILFFLFSYISYVDESLTFSFIVLLFFVSLLFGFIVSFIFKMIMQSKSTLFAKDPVDFGFDILDTIPMSHFKNKLFTDAGIGYMLSNKLVFIPYDYKSTDDCKSTEIYFDEIRNITDFKCFAGKDCGMQITTKSGKTERFEIDKFSDFYSKIISHHTSGVS